MKKLTSALAAVALLAAQWGPAFATGLFPGLPIEGGASYCAGYSVYNTGNTVPGTLPSGNVCSDTVLAGPSSPTGQEYFPVDTQGMNQATPDAGVQPLTAGLAASAVGFGPMVVITATGSKTIPNNTPNYIIQVSETASVTITMPAVPQPWQVQRIAVLTTTGGSGAVVVAANTNQFILPQGTITVAGNSATGEATFIWNPNASTWYRVS
jgi:hypothetical protein